MTASDSDPDVGGESDPPAVTRSRCPLPLEAVDIDGDGFWGERRRVNRQTVVWNLLERLESRLENLRRAAGRSDGGFEGPYHNDPPVYKWVEAASYVLATRTAPELRAALDEVVDLIVDAQQPDGYLHAYYQLEHDPAERWTNLHSDHELFAAGHLFEAAVAHHGATGETRLLDAARRFADHVDERFGPDGRGGAPGHPEIELGLVRLARATGEERYLDLAAFFLDQRGGDRFAWELSHPDEVAGELLPGRYCEGGSYDGRYAQDHAPVREQTDAVGHAVKACFLYAGMVAVGVEAEDPTLVAAAERLWESAVERRTYVTGGVGARHDGEAFGDDYELPNAGAYAETCAAFATVQWNRRLLEATGEARFGDVAERALYNGFLAGVSLDGRRFSYTNPLADRSDDRFRAPWFETVCCPPNVARLLASLERYVYSRTPAAADRDGLYVDLFADSTARVEFGGTRVDLDQTTDYPWAGTVHLDVGVEAPVAFELGVRVPGWCREATVRVNGDPVAERADGYARIEREWTDGDRVELDLAMPAERVRANPAVDADAGRVALQRGPLVYCFEAADGQDPFAIRLPAGEEFDPEPTREAELDGAVALEGRAVVADRAAWEEADGPTALYRPADGDPLAGAAVRAVPYYAWDNREPGAMAVWVVDGAAGTRG